MAVKPVSNGEFCASAVTGMRKSSVKETAVKCAHFDRREVWIRWIRRNWNQRDDICASRSSEIRCLWRKTNLTQSGCPTTSRPRDIPGRNNRGTLCRRSSGAYRLASKDFGAGFVLAKHCLAKRLGNQQTLARASHFPPQGFAQVPATEVDEAVAVCLTRPLWSGCSRICNGICSRKCEVTNRQSVV